MSDQQDPRPTAAQPDGAGRHRATPPTAPATRASRAASGRHRATEPVAPAEQAPPTAPAARAAGPTEQASPA
ncbi:nucleoside-diphosphate sugar epimerase, partial [Actinomyces sp. AC-18-1]|nr:nucleoside-diphosphate sugar epimerase [Actinomyces sp. 187325]